MTLLDRLADESRLLAAWQRVYESGTDDGPPSNELEAFRASAASKVAALALSLSERTWKPSPVVYVPIPKNGGGFRKLAIPTVSDRVVERALLGLLDPVIDPMLSPWSCGYRTGIGVTDALRFLTDARDDELHHVLRADIQDCFERIPRWRLLERLSIAIADPPVVKMVGDLLARPLVGRGAPALPRGRGLHQGSPLSPLLCNLYLDQFDRALINRGWMPIRFGDDMAVPARSRVEAEAALVVVREELENLGLETNLGKTKVASFDEGVDFLGATVTARSGRHDEPASSPLEATVFVTTQGAWLRTRGEHIVVQSGEETLLRLHTNRVRQVVAVGRVGMTAAFIRKVATAGVEVVWVDETAGYDCRITAPASRDPRYRVAQFAAAADDDARLELARAFVVGKIQNMRVGVLRRRRTVEAADASAPGATATSALADVLMTRRAEARVTAGVAELLGVEGAATRAYFQWMQEVVDPGWEFTGRKRRPPPDPVNAMLSFLYTLLANEGIGACEAAKLDADVGFLHRPQPGRASLALDLIEEFRPVLADAVVLTIITKDMLTPSDFTTSPENGCRMSDRAKKVLIGAYEQRMLTLVTARSGSRRVSWRQAIYDQAKHLAGALLDGREYEPVVWK